MRIIYSLLTLVFITCTTEDTTIYKCISFDTRQCMGDPWSSSVDRNSSESETASQLQNYFENQGIEVNSVKVDMDFHEFVCEACFVCPDNPRIYVQVPPAEISKLEAMDLLNPTINDCEDF